MGRLLRPPRDACTAQPTHGSTPPDGPALESGLSLEPEELGALFLSCAVEQGAVSAWPERSRAEVDDADADGLDDDAPSLLDALDEDGEDAFATRTSHNALQRSLLRGPPPGGRARRRRHSGLPPEAPSYAWDELDLTDAAIHDASLLDHEGSELGEVEPPSALRTDDNHRHGKPRGGHLPSFRASRRRA